MPAVIEKSTLQFLKSLAKNNNRDWFNDNKDKYLASLENLTTFVDALLIEMNKHDQIENPNAKDVLMRIYRDTRFSKDKTPYKTYMGGGIDRATKKLRGGYYLQIEPGNSMACGGFYGPNPADLLRIRKDIELNYKEWEKLLKNKSLLNTYGQIQGETLASCPKGFSKDHPAIELLKHKQFFFQRNFTDAEVLDKNFLKSVNQTFKNVRPFFDYMSEVLTTDLNGESLVD